jgi:hypothetical protein
MENSSIDSGVKFDTVVSENQNSITLSKDDFQTILNVLVVVSKRGGFLLEEYKVVGELFDRLKVLSN